MGAKLVRISKKGFKTYFTLFKLCNRKGVFVSFPFLNVPSKGLTGFL